jgi:PAS domain S-box-containing protein
METSLRCPGAVSQESAWWRGRAILRDRSEVLQSPRFAPYSNGTRMSRMAEAGNPAEPIRGDVPIAQPKLHQDEEELRRIVDLIPQQIVLLDLSGRAIFVNQRALEYTGFSLDEVRDESFRERVFHPEDIERLREERQKALAGTMPFENEQRGRGCDGKYRWFLIRYMPLLENHILVLDTQGKLLQANKTMLDFFGYTLDEMKGRGDQERIKRDVHPDDFERTQSERAEGLLGGGVPKKFRCSSHDCWTHARLSFAKAASWRVPASEFGDDGANDLVKAKPASVGAA